MLLHSSARALFEPFPSPSSDRCSSLPTSWTALYTHTSKQIISTRFTLVPHSPTHAATVGLTSFWRSRMDQAAVFSGSDPPSPLVMQRSVSTMHASAQPATHLCFDALAHGTALFTKFDTQGGDDVSTPSGCVHRSSGELERSCSSFVFYNKPCRYLSSCLPCTGL